ncbi:serine hydrolase domain-containing protein [Psychromonas ossibalaenae]|uniref:serine hydrolase domain-containing protein n=1 Tax=Psychromonas ossibalaenae TaxID=444922 RepID=UPI0003771BF7|nr:serine hydrolase domain-containing protein [Psychromonas ossibalaenae]
MIYNVLFLLILAFLSVGQSAQAVPLLQLKLESDFSAAFKKEMRSGRIPGAAFAIVRGDQVSAMQTYGIRGKKSPQAVNSQTVFRLASVSKTFSAELAALMVEQNKFSWNDPIVEYIPEFKLKKAGQAENITIKHILSHSSGLVPNAFDGYLKGRFIFSKVIDKFSALEPACSAGKCYGYQNVLFSFIEEVVERNTGKSYEEVMRSMIFSPLNMVNASVGYDAYQESANKAYPHITVSRRGPWHQVKVNPDFYKVGAAAGVNASIEDMSKWLIAQLGNTPEVISQPLLDTVREPVVRTVKDLRRRSWRGIIDDAHYGIGWRVYQYKDETLYLHSGWVQGFRALIAYSKDKQIGLVLLANAESRSVDSLSIKFWRLLLAEPDSLIPYKAANPAPLAGPLWSRKLAFFDLDLQYL